MAEVIIPALCFAAAAALMWHRMRELKRDIYTFTEKLEKSLDVMEKGEELKESGLPEDTLWGKTEGKLVKINHMWHQKYEENSREKRQMKELISDISHQTRTPVANMKLYLELLQSGAPDSEKYSEFLGKMAGQTEKLDFLLQGMVKMSRLEAGIIEIQCQKARIFETLVRAAEAAVPAAGKKGIKISVECDEEIQVTHDGKWTSEAIFNILDNAVKYTDPGGTVHISVTEQEFFTKISVKDSGKGIAQERQPLVFQRFYREPEVHGEEGIGVGLYLAREIITRQKGYIEVRSEAGAGSEFCIYLPNGI